MDLTLELYRRDLIIDEELILIGKKCIKMKSISVDCKHIFVKKNVFEIFGQFDGIRKLCITLIGKNEVNLGNVEYLKNCKNLIHLELGINA
jgi:hypothetical protein